MIPSRPKPRMTKLSMTKPSRTKPSMLLAYATIPRTAAYILGIAGYWEFECPSRGALYVAAVGA